MGISSPEEFKTKMPISGGLLVYIIMASFAMGVMFAGLLGAKQDIVDDKVGAQEFTEQEVGGLRSDWERGNEISKQDREAQLKRIEALEKYHKE